MNYTELLPKWAEQAKADDLPQVFDESYAQGHRDGYKYREKEILAIVDEMIEQYTGKEISFKPSGNAFTITDVADKNNPELIALNKLKTRIQEVTGD